jgi:poly-gamma-glutamate synthesis protein (capsule biosynthesis protein)
MTKPLKLIFTWLSLIGVTIGLILSAALIIGLTHWPQVAGLRTLAPTKTTTILTTGDMMIGRSVNLTGRKKGYAWSFQDISPFFAGFDYTVVNLENPIITQCPGRNDGMIFCADAASVPALAASQIDLFTLANNHTLNYGQAGLQETQQLLAAQQITSLTQGQFHQVVLNRETYGFLAYDDVSAALNFDNVAGEIKLFAAQVDYLLVAFHFGIEYTYQPTSRQIALAHLAIDAGAIGVIGNHAHWYQAVELYGDGAIIYAHGNLIFDQMWSQQTREGLVAVWSFQEQKLTQLTLYPVYITDYGHAEILPAAHKLTSTILRQLQNLSSLGEIKGNALIIDLTAAPYKQP